MKSLTVFLLLTAIVAATTVSDQSPTEPSTVASPSETTAAVPTEPSTVAPISETTAAAATEPSTVASPSETTAAVSTEPSTVAPTSETTAAAPAETSTVAPTSETTAAVSTEPSTVAPTSETTAAASAETSTATPAGTTTVLPAETSTASPVDTTTVSPSETSTAAPSGTTTVDPNESTDSTSTSTENSEPTESTSPPPSAAPPANKLQCYACEGDDCDEKTVINCPDDGRVYDVEDIHKSLAESAAEMLLHNYRSASRLTLADVKGYACYSVQITANDDKKLKLGCIAIPYGQSACDAVRQELNISGEGDQCVACQTDLCNGSVITKISVVTLLSVLLAKFLF